MQKNKHIRVAHVIGNISEGGIEVMMTNLYRNIDHSKVEFHFIVPNTSVVLNEKEIERYGGKVIIVPSVKKVFKYNKELRKCFNVNQYDIVHASMNALSFIPLKVAKKCGVPVRISHSHSTSHKKEHLRHLIKNCLRPFSKKYATHYFACSEKAGRWLFGNKVVNSKEVFYINNGINLENFSFNLERRKNIRKQLGIADDIFLIGHVGRFVSQKNHPYLLKIFGEIAEKDKRVGLLMVGTGANLDQAKKYVEDNQLNNVYLIGAVSNPYDYYQAMDCFVLPSLYEGLPVVGVEAQANGLKCFFSNEITQEAKLINDTEYLDIKEEPKVWGEKIESYSKLRTSLRVPVSGLEKYDIKNISSYMLDLYIKFINESK